MTIAYTNTKPTENVNAFLTQACYNKHDYLELLTLENRSPCTFQFGYGIRAKERIPKDHYICEYFGKVFEKKNHAEELR